jgi:magnesium chelatase accessory protein
MPIDPPVGSTGATLTAPREARAARTGSARTEDALLERREAGGVTWRFKRHQATHPGPGKRRVLLLHGTGASLHSWEGLWPLLGAHHDLLAPDLPGHGQSTGLSGSAPTLPAMASAVRALLDAENFEPDVVIGHSAGCAIGLALVATGACSPQLVIGLNAALKPYGGLLAPLAQPLARLFAALGPVPRVLAARAGAPGTVERLIEGTGSRLDAEGIEAYRELFSREDHVAATLAMMAHWDLDDLQRRFRTIDAPVVLVVGEGDRTIPPTQAVDVAHRMPCARVVRLPHLGHLAHEEAPALVADAIAEAIAWSDHHDA